MSTKTSNSSIKALLEYIDSGKLVLPEIQREFVWNKKNVLQLFDSLYRGFPIGFMLIWKTSIAVAQGKFKDKSTIKIGQSLDSFYGYLLDGQQRLSAIRLVRDRDEKHLLMFVLYPENEEQPDNNRFSFLSRSTNTNSLLCLCNNCIQNIGKTCKKCYLFLEHSLRIFAAKSFISRSPEKFFPLYPPLYIAKISQ